MFDALDLARFYGDKLVEIGSDIASGGTPDRDDEVDACLLGMAATSLLSIAQSLDRLSTIFERLTDADDRP